MRHLAALILAAILSTGCAANQVQADFDRCLQRKPFDQCYAEGKESIRQTEGEDAQHDGVHVEAEDSSLPPECRSNLARSIAIAAGAFVQGRERAERNSVQDQVNEACDRALNVQSSRRQQELVELERERLRVEKERLKLEREKRLQDCCQGHSGMLSCVAGRVLCKDGEFSPVCRC